MKEIKPESKSLFNQNGNRIKPAFRVRPFQNSDAGQVAKLFQKYFPWHQNVATDHLVQRLTSGYARSDSIPSLVCTSADEKIHGYISVKTIDFFFKGKPIKAAVCSDFIVSEEARTSLVPMRMLQTLLKGPQDFSFSEDATNISRLLWCKLGGEIAYPYTNYYTLTLRPITFFLKLAAKKKATLIRPIINAITPGIDKLYKLTHFKSSPSSKTKLYHLIPLTSSEFEKGLSSVMTHYNLFPNLNKEYLEQYLNSLKKETQYGILEAKALLNQQNKIVGWFIYYIQSQKRCNVIHSECLPGMEEVLLEFLKSDALNNGGTALSGRTSPSQIGTGFTEQSFNRPRKKWVLIHSKNQELLNAVQSGKAFLASSW